MSRCPRVDVGSIEIMNRHHVQPADWDTVQQYDAVGSPRKDYGGLYVSWPGRTYVCAIWGTCGRTSNVVLKYY